MTGEVTALMECFLKDNLLELRETLWNNKFGVTPEGVSLFGSAFAVTSHDGALVPGGGKLHSCSVLFFIFYCFRISLFRLLFLINFHAQLPSKTYFLILMQLQFSHFVTSVERMDSGDTFVPANEYSGRLSR